VSAVEYLEVGEERAADVLAVVQASFAGRPVLDPPSTALDETVTSIAEQLRRDGGLLALRDGRAVGALLFRDEGRLLHLRRVGVLADVRRLGVAAGLATMAAQVAGRRGHAGLTLEAREELPDTVGFWARLGYVEVHRDGPRLTMVRLLPLVRALPTAEDTRSLGERIAAVLRAGDLLVLTGDLGAGKTTFTQGLGAGLQVRGAVTSPTFVIARVHPPLSGGPALVHVDAYRLGGAAELDDLDLDTDLDTAVTVVEWGSGLAESLAADRLELRLERAPDDVRTATLTPVGRRWSDVDLAGVVTGAIA
jgi:tRNA threonylcarbamoyladenosine biosynthesis protein TsaE